MYEETLLQLSRDQHFRSSEMPTAVLSERRNPACGDEIAISGKVENGKIENLSFYAQGCAVCVASCTALCQELNGCDLKTAEKRIAQALEFFEGQDEWTADWGSPALPALGVVRDRPMRMTCVKLAWLALQESL